MPALSVTFQKYKNDRIAIYGLGTETEKVLKDLDREYAIVGLLDGYKQEGTLYDKPIISLEKALESNVKLILVVARPGSCKAIAKRIGKICIENHVDLIDIRGNNLCNEKKVIYDFKGIVGITKEQLLNMIQKFDTISVDLFDTLVMRQTLFPTDVFEMVDWYLRDKGIFIKDFSLKRLECEKYLAKYGSPTLAEIYLYMIDSFSIRNISAGELAKLEWQIDYELIVPRQEICEMIAEAYKQGKDIYIVSDTYYTRCQLEKILLKCNISEYTDIFSSCEYKTSKTQQLFERLKERIVERNCIHLGDDLIADVECAEKANLKAQQIFSGIDLLDMTGYLGLWDSIEELSNRVKIGMFVSKIFNSPFQFETQERKVSVANPYDIGYFFFAPIITDFVLWYDEKVKSFHLQNIWFCARDGFLIKKMYDEMNKDTLSTYFLTSRTAAIRAGMENEEDIIYVEDMQFSGSLKEQLLERFGIFTQEDSIETNETLLDYSKEILSKAQTNRENYEIYISRLNTKEGDIAFFDFVAKGTCQMYVSRLVQNHLKGFYFLQLEEENMKGKNLDITSFYQSDEVEESAIFENYYVLETVLTSPEPSVMGFDEEGIACYGKETRKKEDISCIQLVQNGIYDYFKTYLRVCPKAAMKIDKKLDELFLLLIHRISIQSGDFLDLTVEDPFFNRMTDITDLV